MSIHGFLLTPTSTTLQPVTVNEAGGSHLRAMLELLSATYVERVQLRNGVDCWLDEEGHGQPVNWLLAGVITHIEGQQLAQELRGRGLFLGRTGSQTASLSGQQEDELAEALQLAQTLS